MSFNRVTITFFTVFGLSILNYGFAQFADSIHLNDIRFIASHNSYKKKPDPKVLKFLGHFKKQLGKDMDPIRIDYGHVSISEQFSSYSVRGLELDLYNDPKGGKYAKRRVNHFICGLKQKNKDSVMYQPGLKMLHIADVDYETNYRTFKEALIEIKTWSDAHPFHTPIFINIELKDASPGDYSGALRFLGFKRAIPHDSCSYNQVDKDILSVFKKDRIILPVNLKDTFNTIRERLELIGWPTLNESLGKVIFILDGNGSEYEHYSKEKIAFKYDDQPNESSAFIKRNDPKGHEKEIREITDLYIVRTRTDVETMEARNNDYSMFNAALESEAQIISTDYYKPDVLLSSFTVSLEKYKTDKHWPFILRNK